MIHIRYQIRQIKLDISTLHSEHTYIMRCIYKFGIYADNALYIHPPDAIESPGTLLFCVGHGCHFDINRDTCILCGAWLPVTHTGTLLFCVGHGCHCDTNRDTSILCGSWLPLTQTGTLLFCVGHGCHCDTNRDTSILCGSWLPL